MSSPIGKEIRMDGHSSNLVNQMISDQIGCRENVSSALDGGGVASLIFSGMFEPYGILCKELARRVPEDDFPFFQCVVMGGGFTERCPKFGMTQSGESLGEHERLQKVAELQRFVDKHLNYQPLGNLNVYKD